MKKLLLLSCSLLLLLFGCDKFDPSDIWSNIDSLDKRVTALEELCKKMNTNIEALHTLVNAEANKDYITNVSPVQSQGKVIGYTITFAKSEPITIYHGKDCADGADGQTPVIGVRKDVDGVYYWTIDGEWLLDDAGQKIKTDGKDGITPQLKIEDGKWYVSYNNGVSWVEVGQATGSQGPTGPQGPAGVDGDSMFQSVTYDESNVYLTLKDGTKLTVPRTPESPVTLSLGKVTGFTATFNGTVIRKSYDLKVTVYYSTTSDLTVYKNSGHASQTEFPGNTFEVKLKNLGANTTYYYFYEIIYKGQKSFSEMDTFRTGNPDSLEGWGDGDQIGGGI